MEILASGFLDSSALEANVGVLALLMGYGYRDGFFWVVVALVIVAIVLQLIIGVIMAAKVMTCGNVMFHGPLGVVPYACMDIGY